MTKSLYAILNVAPDADPAVVEAAYKALMKKYHPDVRSDDPEGARRRAAEISEAFHILKDPTRRADYDVGERARHDALRRQPAVADGPHIFPPPPLPRRRRRSKWPALFMIATAALAVFFIWRGSDAALGGEPGTLPDLVTSLKREIGDPAAVDVADVHRAVEEFNRIKERSGLIGLSSFSQDCFTAQSRSDDPSDFDFCVAFDKAALTYGVNLPGHNYLPGLPRFEPAQIARRHAIAGRAISNDDGLIEARIAEVGILTSKRLRALDPATVAADELAASQAAAAPVAAAQPRSRPRQYVQRHQRHRSKPQRRPQPSRDPDFLEREGYIY